jgi:DNA-binding FadR family transcriptional regulator
MSFLPVSEALERLEVEGLLESGPRAGTRVSIPSRDDVHGHFVLREALEGQAAILFAGRATAAERGELSKLGRPPRPNGGSADADARVHDTPPPAASANRRVHAVARTQRRDRKEARSGFDFGCV